MRSVGVEMSRVETKTHPIKQQESRDKTTRNRQNQLDRTSRDTSGRCVHTSLDWLRLLAAFCVVEPVHIAQVENKSTQPTDSDTPTTQHTHNTK